MSTSSSCKPRGLWTAHPHSVGETYLQHCGVALRCGALMALAGLACLVHAVLPFVFTRTASAILVQLHGEMEQRRRPQGAARRAGAA